MVDTLRSRWREKECGGMLVELLLVICILSILVTAVRPLMQIDDHQVLDREAAELVSTIRYVQEMSKTERRKKPLMWNGFSFARISMEITDRDYIVLLQAPSGVSILKKHTVPEGMRIVLRDTASVKTTILFLPNGDVPMGYMQTITLRKGTDARSIVIDQAGRVRVEKRGVS